MFPSKIRQHATAWEITAITSGHVYSMELHAAFNVDPSPFFVNDKCGTEKEWKQDPDGAESGAWAGVFLM